MVARSSLGDREGVKIHDAIDAVGSVLIVDPADQRTEQVSEVDVAGGLDTREHASHDGRSYGEAVDHPNRFRVLAMLLYETTSM